MKKLLVLISAVLICLTGITRDIGASWLMTGENKLDCKKINLGSNQARVILNNGEKRTVPIDLISSYFLNGKEFTKLPLYKNGKPTGQLAFMELVKSVYDLSLYRMEIKDIVASDLNDNLFRYFLYKGDKLHLELDERSAPNVCKVLGLTFISN